MAQLKGIDVSVWNGSINWALTKKEIDFAILRIGYGREVSQKDARFEANYAGCKANGIPVGGYWYNYAKTVDDAKREAQACIKCLNGRKLDYPVWYDIEENSVFATGKANVSKIAEVFCEALKAAGYKVGLYSSYYTFKTYFTDEVKNKYDIWLAHVGNGGAPLNNTGYPDHKEMWQYSWKGRYSGINGNVDEDWSYVNYAEDKDNDVKPAPTPVEPVKPVEKTIDVFYSAYIPSRWLGEIKNCNDVNTNGYAGIENCVVSGFGAKASEGKLRYRVHVKTYSGGKWLGWIDQYNKADWNNGVAGYPGYTVDGIQLELMGVPGYQVMYRVSLFGTGKYLPWVKGLEDYAGLYGNAIDKIQIKIVKA